MNNSPRLGLLPLYLRLYDAIMPRVRSAFEPFVNDIADEFRKRGMSVVMGETTCTAKECRKATRLFLQEGADAIVTLHLAYSPSLEAVDALCASGLPIIMLDTTPDFSFGRNTGSDRIMYNHGIHGVMDLASVLRRRGHPFVVVAGHRQGDRGLMDRAAALVRAAAASRSLRHTRALLIGLPFRGMGDFSVPDSALRRWGWIVRRASVADVSREAAAVTPADIRVEMAADRMSFKCEAGVEDHERSVRVGLGLRRLIEKRRCNAVSFNFQSFNSSSGPACTVPFLEACKGMKRGIGYAGEGDVLTAGLVGSLQRAFGRTTFTEIFCPDWKGNSLFLSHMGEINPEVSRSKPRLVLKDYRFSGAKPPVILACSAAAGPAVFVNLAPCPEGEMTLIVAPVSVLGDARNDSMRNGVRTWVRPCIPIAAFLEEYSRVGGTHHSALVLGKAEEAISAMAVFSGCRLVRIGLRA